MLTSFDTNVNCHFGSGGLDRGCFVTGDGTGAWFVYDGNELVQERDLTTDALTVEYLWGPAVAASRAVIYQNRGGTERGFYTSPQGKFPRYAFNGGLTDVLQYSTTGQLVYQEMGSTEIDFGWHGRWYFGTSTPLPLAMGRLGIGITIPGLARELNGDGGTGGGGDSLDPGFDPPNFERPDGSPYDPAPFDPNGGMPEGWGYCVVACTSPGPYQVCLLAFCELASKCPISSSGSGGASGGATGAGGTGSAEPGGTAPTDSDPGFRTPWSEFSASSQASLSWGGGLGSTMSLKQDIENWIKDNFKNQILCTEEGQALIHGAFCSCFCGPKACASYGLIAAAAAAFTKHGFRDYGSLLGSQAAWRHCFWSCLLAKSDVPIESGRWANDANASSKCAFAQLLLHEVTGEMCGQKDCDLRMDIANNLLGWRFCGQRRRSTKCYDCCDGLNERGRLVTCPPPSGGLRDPNRRLRNWWLKPYPLPVPMPTEPPEEL